MVSQTRPSLRLRLTRTPKARRVGRVITLEAILCTTHGDVKRRVGGSKMVSQTGPSLRLRLTRTPKARRVGCVSALEVILCAVQLLMSNGVWAGARW
jgi:hypothetical protein